jgi:ubiquinone/menaquinone biosynthesis C-methylase UbiE
MSIASRIDKARAIVDPAYRKQRKYEEELHYWRGELVRLDRWFSRKDADWYGIRPPTDPLSHSDDWRVNAVMTMHHMRPSYHEEIGVGADHFVGQRVLEIGNGPLAPILQFDNCERHGVDPLNNSYMEAGWPLYAYDAKFLSIPAEKLPYPDGYFDAVISVNALDHVDDFGAVTSEMQRVLKKGGEVRFEVEYHRPTVTEPLELTDDVIRAAFRKCEMKCIVNRSGREMFTALAKRFDLLENQFERFNEERFVTWAGTKDK